MFYFPDYGGIGNQLGEQVPFAGSSSYPATNGYCTTFTGQLGTSPTPNPVDGGYNCNGYTSPTTVAYGATGDTGIALPGRAIVGFNPAHPRPAPQ